MSLNLAAALGALLAMLVLALLRKRDDTLRASYLLVLATFCGPMLGAVTTELLHQKHTQHAESPPAGVPSQQTDTAPPGPGEIKFMGSTPLDPVEQVTLVRPDTQITVIRPDTPVVRGHVGSVGVQVRDCSASGTTVTCKFSFLATDGDADVGIEGWHGRTKLFDDQGNDAKPFEFSLANKQGSNEASTTLVEGFITSGEIKFSDVREDAQTISLLKVEVVVRTPSNVTRRGLEFRRLPIER